MRGIAGVAACLVLFMVRKGLWMHCALPRSRKCVPQSCAYLVTVLSDIGEVEGLAADRAE